MQMAVSAYACQQSVEAVEAVGALAMADMPGCDGVMNSGLDRKAPQMCKAHCDQGKQAANPVAATDSVPAATLRAVVEWPLTVELQPATNAIDQSVASGAPPPGAPPLYLSFLVLRN